ncbi:MAG TPA: HD domain-containing protein [Candidatus Angelobacter sp.]|nr:HD domain-containing protein [Candidatus Angelobacter sp.]
MLSIGSGGPQFEQESGTEITDPGELKRIITTTPSGRVRMSRRHVTLDPIHGRIEIPPWLQRIDRSPSVRRMMFIRQLGLKAYIDFPGAIHTRYLHGLGSMHLAGKIGDLLAEKEKEKGHISTAENLRASKNTLMAAGFLHDIGHGPFSHAVDHAMKTISGKTHEDLAGEIIDKKLGTLETHDHIPLSSVKQIISRKHKLRFISEIINGPLDVDKLDYLIRDAHMVGLRYSFDVDDFANSFTILGDIRDFEKCYLGLDDSLEAIITAEIFILIWKSMYDLVYHVEQSRIAEKMLEKGVLKGKDDSPNLKDYFTDLDKFIELNDDGLLTLLEQSGGFSKDVVGRIREKRLYENTKVQLNLNEEDVKMSGKFLTDLTSSEDGASLGEDLTRKVCVELGTEPYQIICDIIKSRVPRRIDLDDIDPETKEPRELKEKSDILPHIEQRNVLKVYAHPGFAIDEQHLRSEVVKSIENWVG